MGDARRASSAFIITAVPNQGYAPLLTELQVTALGDDVIGLRWDMNGDGSWDKETDADVTALAMTYATPGEYQPVVQAYTADQPPVVDEATTLVKVFNKTPNAMLKIDQPQVHPPTIIGFDASGSSDPDGTIVKYEFRRNNGDPWLDNGSNPLFQASYNNEGYFVLGVRITDNHGGTAEATSSITLQWQDDKFAPNAQLSVSPTHGMAPLTAILDASASFDPDGSIIKYLFQPEAGSAWIDNGTDPTLEHVYQPGADQRATVRLIDNLGLRAEAAVTLTVLKRWNPAPIALLSANPPSGAAPLSVTLDASASNDAGGTIVKYEFRRFQGDSWIDNGTNPTLDHTYPAGTYAAALRVTDNEGLASETTATVTANEGNNLPPLARLSASPPTGVAPLSVTLDASASSDPDGTIVKYEFRRFDTDSWTDNGTNPILNYTYSLGAHTAAVRVTDNRGTTAETTATVVATEEENAGPTARLAANPPSGLAPLTVTLDAGASNDPDGTIVRYEFRRFQGDSWIDNGSDATIEYSYAAGSYIAAVRVTDNLGATAEVTAEVSAAAGNLPPVARLSAEPPSGQAPLTVTLDAGTSSDPDGAIVKYEFKRFTADTWIDNGLDATLSYTYPLGTHEARIRVTDDDGATAEATVEVIATENGNVPPVAQLSPNPPSGLAPLSVTLDAGASSDPDGAIVKYEFRRFQGDNWIDNGSNATLDYVYPEGTYTASLRVTDNRGSATEATATIVSSFEHLMPELRATPNSGTSRLEVTLDASDSRGPIVKYEFRRFRNDDWIDNGTNPVLKYFYYTGRHFATVRISDATGKSAEAEVEVLVEGPGPGEWYMHGGNSRHSHLANWNGPTRAPQVRWQRPDTIAGTGLVVSADGTVYGRAVNGTDSYGYSPDGALAHYHPDTIPINTGAAICPDGEVAYMVGIYRNNYGIVALGSNGGFRWNFWTLGKVNRDPAVDLRHERVIWGVEDGRLHAHSTSGEGTIWETQLSLFGIDTPPAVSHVSGLSPSLVYAGDQLGQLFVLDHDGVLLNSIELGGPITSGPAIDSQGFVLVGTSEFVYKYTPLLDSWVWRSAVRHPQALGLAIGRQNEVYFSDGAGDFYAVSSTGTPRWIRPLPPGFEGSFGEPVVSGNGVVYACLTTGHLFAFDQAKGAHVFAPWHNSSGSLGFAPGPVPGLNGQVYVTQYNDKLGRACLFCISE